VADGDRIGIIYVHGIGEQRRFEHLDAQIRPLIDAIRRRPHDPNVTIEIVGAPTATLHADQDTWSVEPNAPVRAVFRDRHGKTEIFFHEVWWADVNEPYSFKKELRFWGWGLSIWAFPRKLASNMAGALAVMRPPDFPNGGLRPRDRLVARLKLLGVSNVFLMGAFSVGALTFLAKRLLGLSPPNFVRVFVNYVSTVKLYSQRTRVGGGFLDAYLEPPRVSVRRRMIRTIADVALRDYTRWYIFAHSLGSVVAYNGVMENAHALPNYLDEERWRKLQTAKLAGPALLPHHHVGTVSDMTPARPLWLGQDDVVYRERIFSKLSGLLTYGSPLDKFATIWPARVPINIGEPAFQESTEWINVYDPTDPVGASLDAFGESGSLPSGKTYPASGPLRHKVVYPENYGYRAYWALLYSHLCYMRVDEKRRGQLSDKLAEWVLGGQKFSSIVDKNAAPFFSPGSATDKRRARSAKGMWLIVYLVLTGLGVFSLPFILKVLKEVAEKVFAILHQVWVFIVDTVDRVIASI
jgi:hypothetical protein